MFNLRSLFVVTITTLLISCTAEKPKKGIETMVLTYEADGITMTGYYAYDASSEEKRPGILIVHEWWGHNDYARKRAEMLAKLGYSAFAVDMYGDGKQADHPDDAGKFAAAVMQNTEGAKQRFTAGLNLLKNQSATDPDKISAIGYCFGGGVVLNMARFGIDLDGVVSFHGSLGAVTPAQPGSVQTKVLVCHGADDPFVSQEQIDTFKAEMDNAQVDYQFIAYPGAVHSFTNPYADSIGAKFNMPIKYDKAADEQSWAEMIKFFERLYPKAS
jgi:dienelactone hydrolase